MPNGLDILGDRVRIRVSEVRQCQSSGRLVLPKRSFRPTLEVVQRTPRVVIHGDVKAAIQNKTSQPVPLCRADGRHIGDSRCSKS